MAYLFRTREFSNLDPSNAWQGKHDKRRNNANNNNTNGDNESSESKTPSTTANSKVKGDASSSRARRPITSLTAERKQWILECLNAEPDGIVTAITVRRYISMIYSIHAYTASSTTSRYHM
jgi:hypothetical protein